MSRTNERGKNVPIEHKAFYLQRELNSFLEWQEWQWVP